MNRNKKNSSEKVQFHRKQFGNKLFLLFTIFYHMPLLQEMQKVCKKLLSSVFYYAYILSFEQNEKSELIAVIKA